MRWEMRRDIVKEILDMELHFPYAVDTKERIEDELEPGSA
jgi:hypothetical protein